LGRVIGAALGENPHRANAPGSASAALRLRFSDFAAAAFFQRVPAAERAALFMLYKRALVIKPYSATASGQEAKGRVVHIVPLPTACAAPTVAKSVWRFGVPAEMEFLQALARQGLVASLTKICRGMPKMVPFAKRAASAEIAKSGRRSARLAAFIGDPTGSGHRAEAPRPIHKN
ncbi:MAG: hypothetical protein ACP5P4_17080, partial [Steroidobacteraceae bacterium]